MEVDLVGDIKCPNCGGTHAGHDRWECPDRPAAGVDKSELGDDGRRAAELDPTISVD
jgi:hypothetical protein